MGLAFSDKRDEFGKYQQESVRFEDALLRKDLSGLEQASYDEVVEGFNERADHFLTDYIIFGVYDAISLNNLFKASSVKLRSVINVYNIAPVLAKTDGVFVKSTLIGLAKTAELAGIDVTHYVPHRPGDDASLLLEVALKLINEGSDFYKAYKEQVFIERHGISIETYEENEMKYLLQAQYEKITGLETLLVEQKNLTRKLKFETKKTISDCR